MVHDVEAVNNFVAAGRSNSTSPDSLLNCDYIAYVFILVSFPMRKAHISSSNSTVPNEPAGAFWAVLNRLLIIFQVMVLILSEIGWPMSFFNRFFPVLGSDFGLGAVGVIQCLYVYLQFFSATLLLTGSRHTELVRLSSRIMSMTLPLSLRFSYFLSAASTSCWVSFSGNVPRRSEA